MKTTLNKEELLKVAKQITMNKEMAKAIRDGRKTQTRRVNKIRGFDFLPDRIRCEYFDKTWFIDEICSFVKEYSKYKVGDILCVREPAEVLDDSSIIEYRYKSNGCIKEMARTFLIVTDVRVERLQDISIEDAVKEGLPFDVRIDIEDILHKAKLNTAVFNVENEMKNWWINLWDSVAKDGYKWEDNPYVYVYDFEVVGKF